MLYRLWDIKWDKKDIGYRDTLPNDGTFSIDTDRANPYDDTEAVIRDELVNRFACRAIDFKFDFAEEGLKVFTVCVKRTDCLFVNVMAKDLNHAVARARRRAMSNDWYARWDWDGEEAEVSKADSHEAPGEDADF